MAERTCSVDGCPEPVHANGYCGMHWQRVKKTGDPGPVGKLPQLGRPRPKKLDFKHGTSQGYNHHKCRCNECAAWSRQYQREYSKGTAEARRTRNTKPETKQRAHDSHVRTRYRITPERYREILAEQGGRCANPNCGRTEPGGRGRWCIDHDHDCCETTPICGRCIRGLLCWNCNVAAGHLRDDPAVVDGLAAFLRRGPLPTL